MFDRMTADELRAGIKAVNPAPAVEEILLPAGADRAKMTPAQQETTFSNWVEYIYSRNQNTWTREEQNAIRVASTRVLKGMGWY